ncbi:MAG: hypothetical protein UZ14_CFX002000835 [Chloroflexi bacterium OLB14]|nr:MAG: hypothetical protein UZ14_CFX002000835 [Chloroflexi bacterium OLB14]
MNNHLDLYLNELKREMKWNGTFHKDTFAEIENHLMDSVEGNLSRGLNQAEAEKEAIYRFGSKQVIASAFERGEINSKQQMMTIVSMLMGLFSLYIITRPGIDDMSVPALLNFLVCGLLALLGYWQPWKLALTTGVWIPLYGIFFRQSYGAMLVLMIALIGAYAGWILRIGIYRLRQFI